MAILSNLASLAGGRINDQQRNMFNVQIDDIPSKRATTVSAIGWDIGTGEIREGGGVRRVFPGNSTPKSITITRSFDPSDLNWYLWAYQNATKTGNYRRSITVNMLNPDGSLSRSWVFESAIVSSYTGADFDATSNDANMEQLEIQIEDNYIAGTTGAGGILSLVQSIL